MQGNDGQNKVELTEAQAKALLDLFRHLENDEGAPDDVIAKVKACKEAGL